MAYGDDMKTAMAAERADRELTAVDNRGRLTQALEELEKSVAELCEIRHILEEHMDPLLDPQTPRAEAMNATPEDRGPRSEHTVHIHEIAARVRGQSRLLSDMTERLNA